MQRLRMELRTDAKKQLILVRLRVPQTSRHGSLGLRDVASPLLRPGMTKGGMFRPISKVCDLPLTKQASLDDAPTSLAPRALKTDAIGACLPGLWQLSQTNHR